MKKIFVAFCLLLSLFAVSVYAEEKIDRSLWWSSTADDPGLRRKFEELNRKYFNGTLKVKYIRYGHGLWKQDKLMSVTYYWGVNIVADYAGRSVITIDDEYFVSHPDELESSLLTDMCRVFANMNDRNGNNDNVSSDELPSFKLMMDYLTKVGAKPWLSHKSIPVDSSTNNNTNQTSTKQSSQIAQAAPQYVQSQNNQTSTKQSSQIAQTSQQNKKSFSNTQPVKTTTQTTNLRANPSSDFLYEFRDDNTNALKIIKYVGTSSTIVIPESIEGIPVTAITKMDLKKQVRYNIYVPKSVNFIGGEVFYEIKGNISVDIENTTFFSDCFAYSDMLSGTLTVSKITLKDPYHQQGVFSSTNISKLIVKEGVTEIPNGCFYNCKNLTSITLPNSIEEIDSGAFQDCTALTEVNIPTGKKIYIGPGCFEGCTSLSMATRKKLIECGYEGTFN